MDDAVLAGAAQEVRAGQGLAGANTYLLLKRLFDDSVRRSPYLFGYEPPNAYTREELFHDFLVDRIGTLPDALLTASASNESLVRTVKTIARNWLMDQARSNTDVGSVRHTLEKLLGSDPRFHRPDPTIHRWAVSGSGATSVATREQLTRAAWSVTDVKPGRPASETRRASLAPAKDLARLLEAVLSAADGSVETGVLVDIVIGRCGRVVQSEEPVAPDDPRLRDADTEAVDEPSEEGEALRLAKQAWEQLPDEARRIVPFLNDVAAIRTELGAGRSQAYLAQKRLQVTLGALTPDTGQPELFVAALLAQHQAEYGPPRTSGGSVRHSQTVETSPERGPR